jgi:hypothetical protein
MKLTKVAIGVVDENIGASLRKRMAELKRDKEVLRLAVDHSAEHYEMAIVGNRKLSSEHDQLKIRCESLEDELAQAHSDPKNHVSDLESRVRFAKARGVEIAAEGEKKLVDFRSMLVERLERLHEMYADKVQSIGGLCSVMSAEEPSVEDYLNWLSEEMAGLPDMFSGMNENFATAAIEGALTLAGNSVDLDVVRVAASESGTDVLPNAFGVCKVARAVSKKWWRSFDYDYVMSVIHAEQSKVPSCFLILGSCYLL